MVNIRFVVAGAVALFGGATLPACSADASSDGETQELVAQTREGDTTVICPVGLSCCLSALSTALAWDEKDPFESQLSAWGCSKPRLYAPSTGKNAWWFVSTCTDTSKRVETFLASSPKWTAAPYLATSSTILNPLCVPLPFPGQVDVVWDPTCSTCKAA